MTGRARRIVVAGLLLATLAPGCARNPVSGLPELQILSTEAEREIGRDARAQLEQTVAYVPDDALQSYVDSIVQRLAAESPRTDLPYEVRVLDLTDVNAFALPGGYLFVTRGLLALTNDEDELAGVLGHEMAHVAAKHATQRIKRAAPLGIATGITSLAVGIVSSSLGNAVAGLGGLANRAIVSPYSRSQEREADRVGLAIASRAGWDPSALSRFLGSMLEQERLQHGEVREAGFLDTHPGTAERVDDTARLAREMSAGAASPAGGLERGDFLARLDGLVVGEDPVLGAFLEDGRFVHPEMGFVVEFPPGWPTMNAATQVAARSPSGHGLVALVLARGDDAADAAHRFVQAARLKLDDPIEEGEVNGLRTARAHLRASGGRADMTWVQLDGTIFQLVGLSDDAHYPSYATAFREVTESFRPALDADREQLRVTRLRVVEARAGERLDELAARTGSTWAAPELAVMNALDASAPLVAGQLVKVALDEAYR